MSMNGIYRIGDQGVPSHAVFFSTSHPLFSLTHSDMLKERDERYVEGDYQKWLRAKPFQDIDTLIWKMRDLPIVTARSAIPQARVLMKLAHISGKQLQRWHKDDWLDYSEMPTQEDEAREEREERRRNDPLMQAQDHLRAWLDERNVHYTNAEFNSLFTTMRVKIARGSAPFAGAPMA